MLTKDLLRFRTYKGAIKPQFISISDPALLKLADQLISAYRNDNLPSRGEIEETTTPLINAAKEVTLARGLNKLLLDRSDFSHGDEIDYPQLRQEIFNASGELLKDKGELSYEEYKNKVLAQTSLNADILKKGLYADLPENEKLISFKDLSAEKLLERYNCSLVQSLLLNAKSLDLRLFEPEAAKMRQLFKYLKFFRLLARIFQEEIRKKNKKGEESLHRGFRIVIDGPLSLFENTRKYSLQLASFFPALCNLTQWKMETVIKIGRRNLLLKLDEKSNLSSHYRHFGNYTPPEIILFKQEFKNKVSDWKITNHAPFLDAGDQELIFPDFTFKNCDGKIVHLELFHRWHIPQLKTRLKFGTSNPNTPLLIGVDRTLYNKSGMKKKINSNKWFSSNGFLFNDFPGIDILCKALNRLS